MYVMHVFKGGDKLKQPHGLAWGGCTAHADRTAHSQQLRCANHTQQVVKQPVNRLSVAPLVKVPEDLGAQGPEAIQMFCCCDHSCRVASPSQDFMDVYSPVFKRCPLSPSTSSCW